jgi:transcriptional regulator with XRE-family HTH domain
MWTNAFSNEDIGEHIVELRRERGLTQAQFAEQLGVSAPTVSSLESGGSVSSALLVRAINFLGARIVIVPKSARVEVQEPANG